MVENYSIILVLKNNFYAVCFKASPDSKMCNIKNFIWICSVFLKEKKISGMYLQKGQTRAVLFPFFSCLQTGTSRTEKQQNFLFECLVMKFFVFFYFLLTIYGIEKIILRSSFRNGDFNRFICFEVPWIQKLHFERLVSVSVYAYVCICRCVRACGLCVCYLHNLKKK